MRLQLKRDGNFNLFAKLELNPEERSAITKAKPEKTYLWMPDGRSAQKQWRRNLIPGAFLTVFIGWVIGIFIVGISDAHFLAPWIGLVIWVPCTKLFFSQNRDAITVSDLITGRTITNGSLQELAAKEQAIT